jgi:magnesium-transporting ATPase (P-type)
MEHPNKLIDSFTGILDLRSQSGLQTQPSPTMKTPLLPNNILLRGCTLRNTEWAIGLVINTGHDTKIMMSGQQQSITKYSSLDLQATTQIRRIIIFLLLICFGAATGQAVMDQQVDIHTFWYLRWNPNPILFWFIKFFYSLLLHATFIPVSLYVSMSLARFYQSLFMNQDLDMYYEATDTPAVVRTMTLNDELGCISHVFTDKTGTLTRNILDFRKCSIAGVSYGTGITEIGRSTWKLLNKPIPAEVLEGEARAQANAVPHVSFYCPKFDEDYVFGAVDSSDILDIAHTQPFRIREFFRVLSI